MHAYIIKLLLPLNYKVILSIPGSITNGLPFFKVLDLHHSQKNLGILTILPNKHIATSFKFSLQINFEITTLYMQMNNVTNE